MAFNKCECFDGQTVITAKMMNDIQDAICDLEGSVSTLDGSLQDLREDVEALPEGGSDGLDHMPTPEEIGAHPNTWMPTAEEVGARPDTWVPTAAEVGARPDTWTPSAADVGARPSNWLPTAAQIGAATPADIAAAERKAFPRNLLDNSDFRNPVNQRGLTAYTTAGYAIDRWTKSYSRPLTTVQDGHITLENTDANYSYYFMQRLPVGTLMVGKTYTAAIQLHDGTILSEALALASDSEVSSQTFSQGIRLCLDIGTTYDFFALRFSPLCAIDVDWVALYEGAYTAETLPEYQPKGYGHELLECQRYFQIRSTNNVPAADMRPTMRLASPTITGVTGGYSYSADL